MGCDYTDSIRGVGPKRAIELMRRHKSIETILENIDRKTYPAPDNWNYEGARNLFEEPEVSDCTDLEVQTLFVDTDS